jgi:hypothetical protein
MPEQPRLVDVEALAVEASIDRPQLAKRSRSWLRTDDWLVSPGFRK